MPTSTLPLCVLGATGLVYIALLNPVLTIGEDENRNVYAKIHTPHTKERSTYEKSMEKTLYFGTWLLGGMCIIGLCVSPFLLEK